MSSFSIKGNLKKTQSSAVASFFTGETETVREKLQRQQVVNDLNYGFEEATADVDPEEEALGDIYDIDKFLEEKEERQKKEEIETKAQKKINDKKSSEYIAVLKQRAAERKRELDIIYEKNKIKEREKEDAMYAGKEKFITNAYKRKLEADRKWLDDVRKREEQSKNNKSSFLTRLFNSRTGEPQGPVEAPKAEEPPKPTPPQEEEDDEFDGFIMAPPEDQIQGNVEMSSDDDAGFIMAPKEHSHRRRSRSRSRSRSHHRHHSHHRSHHRHRDHLLVYFKQKCNFAGIFVVKNFTFFSIMLSLLSTSNNQLEIEKVQVSYNLL